MTWLAMTVIAWSVAWGTGFSETGHGATRLSLQDSTREALYRAGRNVDEAWERFHRAALGGTLRSPAVQRHIEQALHESRRLLTQAREAATIHDHRAVLDLTTRIEAMTDHIKADSQRHKP